MYRAQGVCRACLGCVWCIPVSVACVGVCVVAVGRVVRRRKGAYPKDVDFTHKFNIYLCMFVCVVA